VAYNTKRKKRREKRTPEQVEAEKAAQRISQRGLRRARKDVEQLARAGAFAKTKLWEVPGRDYKLKHFTEDPHQAVLAYYANSGSWSSLKILTRLCLLTMQTAEVGETEKHEC
jgi:hypothetical protein